MTNYHIDPSKLVIHNKLVKLQNFHNNGRLYCEIYYLNGKRHNPNGPAYQLWHASGRLFREEYYLNGIYYSKREYDKLAKSYYNIHSE